MSLKNAVKGSEFIARMLHGYGISHVFLVEAIMRRSMVELEKLGVRRIVAHSEKAAAYMADGYARAARKPGVCFAQSVGAANLASGLQDAWLSGSPVLAVTGQKPPLHQHRNAYQEIAHTPLFAPVTKYNVSVTDPGQLPPYLRQAFRAMTSGRPGPAHIDVPNNLGFVIDTSTITEEPVAEAPFSRVPAFRPLPDAALVAQAAGELLRAARPVIIAGAGAVVSGAEAAIAALAERLGIPVACSVDGVGVLPDAHPLRLGPVGGYARPCANEIVKQADLVLYIGCGVGDQVTADWTIPAPGTRIIQVDIDPAEPGRNYPNTLGIPGDAKRTAAALLEAVGEASAGSGRPGPQWAAEAARAVAAWRERVAPLRDSAAVPIRPERLCRDLEAVLPDDALLVADTGFSAIWTATLVGLKAGQRYLRPAGGSLGWALPASLGAKCALPDTPVVCFTGDGALWYHIAELETAARHAIATVTVVNNNGGFGQCLGGIRAAYGDAPGRKEDLYAFGSVSFANLAREMGLFATRVEAPADIAPAIREALACGRPALVEVLTGIECSPWGG